MNDSRENTYALLLLAGGKSSRMGRDKGQLLYQNRSFLDTLLQKASEVGLTHFYLSQHACVHENVLIIEDHYKDCGPIGGIHACMKAMDLPYCLVLPVDIPQIPIDILRGLLDEHSGLCREGIVPPALLFKHGGREEPLVGIYSTALAASFEANIQKGKCSIFSTLNDAGYRVWEQDVPEWMVDNINTPDAYQRLLSNSKKED